MSTNKDKEYNDWLEKGELKRKIFNLKVDILRVPRRTAQLELQRLKKLKMIKQVGRGPASAYVLI